MLNEYLANFCLNMLISGGVFCTYCTKAIFITSLLCSETGARLLQFCSSLVVLFTFRRHLFFNRSEFVNTIS